VLVHPGDLTDAGDAALAAEDRHVARNLAALQGFSENQPVAGWTTVRLQFHARPVRLLGTDRVTGVEVERTTVDEDGRAVGTGETATLPADLVVRSVGYQGHALPGLPLQAGTVPHQGGRVLRDGVPSTGEYVAGWIKRGPTGVVGTNKHDARETVASLLADAASGVLAPRGDDDWVDTLVARGGRPVLLADWRAIDAAEIALGAVHGRARTTLHDREQLLAAVRSAAAAAEG
jgi:ferredoxin--NADP+ reductase